MRSMRQTVLNRGRGAAGKEHWAPTRLSRQPPMEPLWNLRPYGPNGAGGSICSGACPISARGYKKRAKGGKYGGGEEGDQDGRCGASWGVREARKV
eukprot:1232888-Pyramimonas_sp.AAC.1